MTQMLLHSTGRIQQQAGATATETMTAFESAGQPPSQATGEHRAVSCFGLTGGVRLIVVDLPGPERQGTPPAAIVPIRDGRVLPAPLVRVMLPLLQGGLRQIILFQQGRDTAGIVTLVAACGAVLGRSDPAQAEVPDIAALTDGLDATGQLRLLRQLLDVCRDVFRLGDDVGYGHFCHRVVAALAPRPAALRSEASVGDDLTLSSLALPPGIGTVREIFAVGTGPVHAGKYGPVAVGKGRHVLLLERRAQRSGGMLAILGSDSVALLRMAPPAEPSLLRWLQLNKTLAPAIRDYVTRCLAEVDPVPGTVAASLLRELDFFQPAKRRNLTDPKIPLGAAVELLVGDGEGGLFVKGWVRDPQELSDAAVLSGPGIGSHRLDAAWIRYPRTDIDRHYSGRPGTLGFVACLPCAGRPHGQARLELRLGSGASFDILARTTSGSASQLRDAVLGSVPPQYLTTRIIAEVIAPAASRLHRAHLAARQAPDIVTFGTQVAKPRCSLIIPLYHNLDYLRFQIGSFAVDPDVSGSEIIFVLDSPEQRADLLHLLSGLHQLYQLPLTVLVMSGNFGYAAANNAAAAIARGRFLVLLNSDVVPEGTGWLKALSAPVERSRRVVASGARLLFEDHSLQHAGMRFARDAGGHWLNLHYYKGAPRDFPPALESRLVPAVTGAALLVRRKAFADVGGFTEDYIIGDYEDSDLCLKLRAKGGEIEYAPAAVMFHFERKSINRHAGYQRSVAGLYNRWLAGSRWHAEMAALMQRFPGGATA